jgi:hypothetical protein
MQQMNIMDVFRGMKKWAVILLLLTAVSPLASAAAGDLMSTICRNQVVSVGDRKGEVSTKCGPPLSKSQDAVSSKVSQTTLKKKSEKKQADDTKPVTTKKKTVKERADTWTYIIDGSYRFLIFKEGKLATIEAGSTAN